MQRATKTSKFQGRGGAFSLFRPFSLQGHERFTIGMIVKRVGGRFGHSLRDASCGKSADRALIRLKGSKAADLIGRISFCCVTAWGAVAGRATVEGKGKGTVRRIANCNNY